ncbi:Cupin 2 conserved barrel domain protein [Parvibaculum lavamentivorans DS-1]|uniref:Cupin 2 conserved barrel domain protein n=1 Tax=Parvibaculum lavamentivorans (strain DS-1 / DSM 13023 / NCIMB 13966) TaxID=402881 RepID=A7HQV4_PARL1|nr:cupin domain-containing protein [Parvibaculum lavamentivorans]ABS62287.1 Cupin 2 conserved barrel domain protein [Parvibaculum lavamentivorans DS-1]
MNERNRASIETGNPERELFHLKTCGEIKRREFSLTAMREAGEEGGLLLARMKAEGPDDLHADQWEIHPEGDEFIHVLEGEVALILEGAADGVTLTAGDAAIVPRGRWHRFDWMGPVALLFVTPPGGTELRDVAASGDDR